MQIPTKEEWYAEKERLKETSSASTESYDEFVSWINTVNETLDRYQKLQGIWSDFLTDYLKKTRQFAFTGTGSSKTAEEKKIEEVHRKTQFLPSLRFDWKHALLVSSRKQRIKDYQRANTLLEKTLAELTNATLETVQLPFPKLEEVKVFFLLCAFCGGSLGSTSPEGFVSRETWKEVPTELSCPICRVTYQKPRNPWRHPSR